MTRSAAERIRPTCETCRFWQPPRDSWAWHGDCKRRAPQAVSTTRNATRDGRNLPGEIEGYVVTRFPETQKEDWCGEHEPAAAKEGA